jgi:hypothetical protein
MREDQIDQAERRETLENDRKVLEQRGGTFYQHGLAQADELSQGRFATVGAPRVIGSTPTPASQYPAASVAHQTELPPEPPLGFDNPELDPAGVSSVSPPAATGDPASAPSGGDSASSGELDVERAGSSSSQLGDPAVVSFPSHPDALIPSVDAGSPSTNGDDEGSK